MSVGKATMKQTKLSISNIQTTDLLYYDPAFGDQGYQFCRDRDIDCLPSLEDPTRFYRRDDQTQNFRPEKLTPERCVSSRRSIFHPELLNQLRTYPLLFVMEDGELSGVVHFADYNNPAVSDFLYACLASYERNLRQLAILSGLSDADMGAYFRQKLEEQTAAEKDASYFQGKVTKYDKGISKRAKAPAFQSFYLDDLLGVLKYNGVISLKGKVNDLRNSVMHAHAIVNMVDMTTPDYIYDFKSFKEFFERARALFDDARRVENRIRFLENGDNEAVRRLHNGT